jgi:hypothetical protein
VFVQDLPNLELVVDLDFLDVSSTVFGFMSWATNSTTYVYNTLKMKQIPTLKQKFTTRLK